MRWNKTLASAKTFSVNIRNLSACSGRLKVGVFLIDERLEEPEGFHVLKDFITGFHHSKRDRCGLISEWITRQKISRRSAIRPCHFSKLRPLNQAW
jgi:hypothetical protein